jgi:hypothetical protein
MKVEEMEDMAETVVMTGMKVMIGMENDIKQDKNEAA